MKIDHTEKALYGRPLSRRSQMMLGAVAGDIIGSVFKGKANAIKEKTGWPLFRGEEIYRDLDETRRRGTSVITEDTVQMLAICDALLEMSAPRRHYSPPKSYNAYAEEAVRRHCRKSSATFSPRFYAWLYDDTSEPYGSRGNVAAARAIPAAAYAPSMHRAQTIAKGAAELSHDHPDAVWAADAVASCLSAVLDGCGVRQAFNWYYKETDGLLDDIRTDYAYNGTVDAVPYAIRAALEGPDFEGVIRSCVALGGDSPTLCAIAGALAALLYGLPQEIADQAWQHMPQPEWRDILLRFTLLCDNFHDKHEQEEEEGTQEAPPTQEEEVAPQRLAGIIMAPPPPEDEERKRIRGCLLGLFCGNALGAPLEFKSRKELQARYPKGVARMVDGWNATAGHMAGTLTAASEMSIALLTTLKGKHFSTRPEDLHKGYLKWLGTNPPGVNPAIREAVLHGKIDIDSQDDTPLLRVTALVVHYALENSTVHDSEIEMDMRQTHADSTSLAACKVFAQSLVHAIKGHSPFRIYAEAVRKAAELHDETLLDWLGDIAYEPEGRYETGSMEYAIRSAYYWLLHAKSFRTPLLLVVNNLASPSTTGAVTGALLGAHFGADSIPAGWKDAVFSAPQRTVIYTPDAVLKPQIVFSPQIHAD